MNLRLAPIGGCQTLWTPDGGTETNMGLTKEGVTIKIATSLTELECDEYAVPYDSVVDKIAITSEILLVQADMDTIAACIGAMKTTVTGPPAKTSIDMSPVRGESAPFGKLVFHPRKLASSDKTQDVTIWNAMVQMSGDRIFTATKQGLIQFSVKAGLYWDSTLSKYKVYTEGDPTTGIGFEI